MMYWTLAGAIAAEILATTSMKFSDGFTRLWPSLITLVGYVLSFWLLAQTLKAMPVSTAYAIWSAAGTTIIAMIGMVFLGEAPTVARIIGVTLVVAGVVVLHLGGATH